MATGTATIPISNDDNEVVIGAGSNGNPLISEYFNGTLDEMRVYNRALSQSEIQTDMNTPIPSLTTTAFVYDGDGGRVKKTVGTTTTRYISQLYECENSNCSRYIWAGDTRIAIVPDNPTGQPCNPACYFNDDHLSSTNLVTGPTGARVETITYRPYGDIHSDSPGTPVNTPYKYTGQERDASTGLLYYNARYYDPRLGRFISADSVVSSSDDPQSLNRYSYARNNPLLYTDPSGHIFGIDDLIIVAIVIGATVGAVSSGIQSDWDLQATLLGGVIGGVSAGVGFGTFGPASAAFASLGDIGSGIAGGAVAGAVAGGTSGALAMAAGYKVNIGLAIASGAAAGGIVGGAGAFGAQFGQGTLAAFAAAPAAGASAAAISGSDPGIGAAIAAATAAFALGVHEVYQQYALAQQGPQKETSYATRVGNFESTVRRNSINISKDGLLTFDVKVTGLPAGSNLSTRLQTGLVVNLTDNVNVNFRSWAEIPSLPPGVDANGIAHFGVSVSGITGPAYMRIIPQGLAGPPPVITNFGPGLGKYIHAMHAIQIFPILKRTDVGEDPMLVTPNTIGFRRVSSFGVLIPLVTLIVIALYPQQQLYGEEGSSKGESLLSSLYGVHLEQMHLYVDTDYKYHDVIHDLVLRSFKKRGLKIDMDPPHWPYKQGHTLLHLTVRSEPLHGEKTEKVLYYRKLELFEHVISDRSPHIRAWAVTWSYGIPDPIVTDPLSLEQLEKDADDLLTTFIQDFLYANKK